MDKEKRKALINAYKERTVTGGVYCIECSGNNRKWIMSTTDLDGAKSRYEFSIKIKSCPEPTMRSEWSKYGAEAFSFTVLEELKKDENQTAWEFSDDIDTLYKMWVEKLESAGS